jgi:hypothetical protein
MFPLSAAAYAGVAPFTVGELIDTDPSSEFKMNETACRQPYQQALYRGLIICGHDVFGSTQNTEKIKTDSIIMNEWKCKTGLTCIHQPDQQVKVNILRSPTLPIPQHHYFQQQNKLASNPFSTPTLQPTLFKPKSDCFSKFIVIFDSKQQSKNGTFGRSGKGIRSTL